MTASCKSDKNKNECSCPKNDCPRHGKCCECVATHKNGEKLPHCLRKE